MESKGRRKGKRKQKHVDHQGPKMYTTGPLLARFFKEIPTTNVFVWSHVSGYVVHEGSIEWVSMSPEEAFLSTGAAADGETLVNGKV